MRSFCAGACVLPCVLPLQAALESGRRRGARGFLRRALLTTRADVTMLLSGGTTLDSRICTYSPPSMGAGACAAGNHSRLLLVLLRFQTTKNGENAAACTKSCLKHLKLH